MIALVLLLFSSISFSVSGWTDHEVSSEDFLNISQFPAQRASPAFVQRCLWWSSLFYQIIQHMQSPIKPTPARNWRWSLIWTNTSEKENSWASVILCVDLWCLKGCQFCAWCCQSDPGLEDECFAWPHLPNLAVKEDWLLSTVVVLLGEVKWGTGQSVRETSRDESQCLPWAQTFYTPLVLGSKCPWQFFLQHFVSDQKKLWMGAWIGCDNFRKRPVRTFRQPKKFEHFGGCFGPLFQYRNL